ncbi:MAG: hypothetical protein AABZ61_12245, partial [Bacteroidota bacterium]
MSQLTQGPIWQISFGDGYAGSAKFALLTTQYLQNHGCDVAIAVSTNSLTEKRAGSRGLRTISLDTSQPDGVVFEKLQTAFTSERPRLIVSHHSLERKLSMRLKRKFKREFKNVAFRNIVALSLPLVSAVPYNLWFDY